jgi:hypothetical protein
LLRGAKREGGKEEYILLRGAKREGGKEKYIFAKRC